MKRDVRCVTTVPVGHCNASLSTLLSFPSFPPSPKRHRSKCHIPAVATFLRQMNVTGFFSPFFFFFRNRGWGGAEREGRSMDHWHFFSTHNWDLFNFEASEFVCRCALGACRSEKRSAQEARQQKKRERFRTRERKPPPRPPQDAAERREKRNCLGLLAQTSDQYPDIARHRVAAGHQFSSTTRWERERGNAVKCVCNRDQRNDENDFSIIRKYKCNC